MSGLEAVCLDEDDEVAVREKLEEAVLEFRDARNGTLLHVVAGLQGADLAEDAALAVFRVLETKAGEACSMLWHSKRKKMSVETKRPKPL